MTDKELGTKLYEKLTAEQAQYRRWLLSQPPDEILNHATEYNVREDVVMEMSAMELTEAQAKALLKSPSPLADIYREWNRTETHHMDDVKSVVEARADAVIRLEREKNQREAR